jgi:hypothetical protein
VYEEGFHGFCFARGGRGGIEGNRTGGQVFGESDGIPTVIGKAKI